MPSSGSGLKRQWDTKLGTVANSLVYNHNVLSPVILEKQNAIVCVPI